MLKRALITGATGAIGKAIARGIAQEQGYEVVLLCRDEEKAQAAAKQISKQSGNPRVSYVIADLSLSASIRELRKNWSGPLDVLVNNAAAVPRRRQETKEGLELQFATNIMGYFWLIDQFQSLLKQSAFARVINVASYWAGDLLLSDLQFSQRSYGNNTAYRQAKQADRMLTIAFAERLSPAQIAVNACHPGDVNSALSNSLGFGGHQSPEEGARTPVWLATQSTGKEKTGKYFDNKLEVSCQFAHNKKDIEALYSVCARYA